MAKLMKETPVYLTCPSCGKVQHPGLKWAKNHKALKCKHCGKSMSLAEKETHGIIARTLRAVETFMRSLDSIQAEAKKTSKEVKAHQHDEKAKKKAMKKGKKKAKKGDKKKGKKAGKKSGKKPAKKASSPSKPVSMMPVAPAPGSEPQT